MENALLVGLSRQTALQRELDVVANNIANLNTTGFKADGAVFSEFLQATQREQFVPPDQRAELRAGPHDLARHGPGHDPDRPATRSMSRSTATACWWCRPRAANATPETARCRSTTPASLSPSAATRSWAKTARSSCSRPTETSSSPRTAPSRSAKASASTPIPRAASCGLSPSPTRSRCRRTAPARFAAPDGVVPQPVPDASANVVQGAFEKSNVRPVIEMTRMIELTRAYTEVATMLQQQSDLRKNSIQQLADVPA